MGKKKWAPDRIGELYSDEEIMMLARYKKLRATIPHVADSSILKIVRSDITSEWEQIKQKKVGGAVQKCVSLLTAAGFSGNRFVIDVEDDGSVKVIAKKVNRKPIPKIPGRSESPRDKLRANGTSDAVLRDAKKKPAKRQTH